VGQDPIPLLFLGRPREVREHGARGGIEEIPFDPPPDQPPDDLPGPVGGGGAPALDRVGSLANLAAGTADVHGVQGSQGGQDLHVDQPPPLLLGRGGEVREGLLAEAPRELLERERRARIKSLRVLPVLGLLEDLRGSRARVKCVCEAPTATRSPSCRISSGR
jgi:hypothetical protein